MDAPPPNVSCSAHLMLVEDNMPHPKAPWRQLFLDTLAETSSVCEAARASNIPPSWAYTARRNDADFRSRWREALREGYEHLEMETLHRLRLGTAKDDNKFDPANALRLLTLHRKATNPAQSPQASDSEDSVLAILNAKIEAMREREAEVKQMLAEDLSLADDLDAGD